MNLVHSTMRQRAAIKAAIESERKVIAGPAGHWYALLNDPQYGETLVGQPMMRNSNVAMCPPHPSVSGLENWYEITDPAPECDDEALIAELKR